MQRRFLSRLAVLTAAALFTGAHAAESPKPAEPATAAANAKVLGELNFSNREDFESAKRGFVAAIPGAEVKTRRRPRRLQPEAVRVPARQRHRARQRQPEPVAPRADQPVHGLFKVTDRVYQVRGIDLANMTIIEGDTGLILIDPLLSAETARAALDLYLAHRPRKPVVAVIYTHTHVDHFGGVRGVIDEADALAGKVKVIAPTGFMEHAVSENVIAGNAMSRRAQYQFGTLRAAGAAGPDRHRPGHDALARAHHADRAERPDREAMDTRTVDGVQMVFQLTPGTEAPAELNVCFPQFKVLNVAENVTPARSTTCTRCAAPRCATRLAWAKYIDESRELFGRPGRR